MRKFILAILPFLLLSCNSKERVAEISANPQTPKAFYSKNVADSFSIFISTPDEYDTSHQNYPIVYLLDANLYFDIVATTLKKYAEVGLADPVILVGIGYKDIQTMDSLRDRDYTFPQALPEYEMTASGGANKFLDFIEREVVPYIDHEYRTDSSNRILMGHSLGGYFTAYALLKNLSGTGNHFNAFIAASPSLHYNDYYVIKEFNNLSKAEARDKKLKAYFTFGGLEEDPIEESSIIPDLISALSTISKKQAGMLSIKTDIFTNLDHMDTPIPTFIKGLQWVLTTDK
jgi:predicted alpha/beta superfamily hydrolase